MIYINDKRNLEGNERCFLDSEMDVAIGTFKSEVMKPNATYVVIEWVQNTAVLLPDRDFEVV